METSIKTLSPENMIDVKGGKDVVKVCINVEITQCIKVEGKYCGTGLAYGPIEIIGPVDPWQQKLN